MAPSTLKPEQRDIPGFIIKNKIPFIYFFLKILFIFWQRGRDKERERNINVWLLLTHPLLGTRPTTQECALTGSWTSNPLGFTSWYSIHWATPARAKNYYFLKQRPQSYLKNLNSDNNQSVWKKTWNLWWALISGWYSDCSLVRHWEEDSAVPWLDSWLIKTER